MLSEKLVTKEHTVIQLYLKYKINLLFIHWDTSVAVYALYLITHVKPNELLSVRNPSKTSKNMLITFSGASTNCELIKKQKSQIWGE